MAFGIDHLAETLGPLDERLERGPMQPVEAASPLLPDMDEVGVEQHAKVLRERRGRQVEWPRQRADVAFTRAQSIEHGPPRRIGHGPEDVSAGEDTAHAGYIIR